MNSKKILVNVFGTGSYNLLLLINLAVITKSLKPELFTHFTSVVAASGLGAVIFGAGIPAWMQINLAEPRKVPMLSLSVARASCAVLLLQCLAGMIALLGYLWLESGEQASTLLNIYLLQMAMVISFLADGVAIGLAAVWFLNVRRLIPEVMFLSYLGWSTITGSDLSAVTEVYVLCWVVTAATVSPFITKRIGVTLRIDRGLWVLVWQASAYLQWALAQAATQRGSVLVAASYGTYDTVVLFRWAQIIATTASHAYNAIAQVVFPLHKAKHANSRISLMAALSLAELRFSSAIALNAVVALILVCLYCLTIKITSDASVSAGQAFIFVIFSMATIAYLSSSTVANWSGFRIQYLLSQYIALASALLVLILLVVSAGRGLYIPDVSYLLGALAAGKIAGFIFLIVSRRGKESAAEVDKK